MTPEAHGWQYGGLVGALSPSFIQVSHSGLKSAQKQPFPSRSIGPQQSLTNAAAWSILPALPSACRIRCRVDPVVIVPLAAWDGGGRPRPELGGEYYPGTTVF